MDGAGDFIVAQVERDDPGETELRGPVDGRPATSGDSFTGMVSILGISILTDGSTEFEDANDVVITGTKFFTDVNDGDLVGFKNNDPADVIADEVEFED